jgi:Flp pilus assembly protein TadD
VILGALIATLVPAQAGNNFSPDHPGIPNNSSPVGPSSVGADNDAPLGTQAMPSDGQDAVSVDVLRHPITEKAHRMLHKALEKLNSGNDEAAREQLLEMLAKYPDSAAYVHSILGVIYVRTSRFTEAVSSFEQAVSWLPHDAMTHYNFGLSLACAREYDRAEQEVRRALELDPKNTSAQTLLGILLHRKQPTSEPRDPTPPLSRTEASSRSEGHSGN